jgi:small GTP-binding protein
MAAEHSFKVVVVGASGVGKTALVTQLVTQTFKSECQPTIGVEFKSYVIPSEDDTVRLQIWDTAGQERFRSVAKAYFRNAYGAVLVFDLTAKASFDELGAWVNDLNALCIPNAYVVMVGNKADLGDDRTVSENEAQETARRYNLEYVETSAKTGDRVADAFVRLANGILRQVKRGQIETARPTEDVVDTLQVAARADAAQACPC